MTNGDKIRSMTDEELHKKFGFHVFDEDKEYLFMRLEALKDAVLRFEQI